MQSSVNLTNLIINGIWISNFKSLYLPANYSKGFETTWEKFWGYPQKACSQFIMFSKHRRRLFFLNYTKAKSILFCIQRSRKHIAFKMTSQHKFVQHHLWTYIYTDNILFAYCSKVNSCSSFLSETKNKKFFSPWKHCYGSHFIAYANVQCISFYCARTAFVCLIWFPTLIQIYCVCFRGTKFNLKSS